VTVRDQGSAAAKVRRCYDKTASRYDRQIKLFERLMLTDGRQWVCSQASGDVQRACETSM
jgi:hypothetical protein